MTYSIGKYYKWELLALFWLANFLNQGDRQIFNSILPLIRDGLGATDVQMGLVATIFSLAFGLLIPLAGWFGDRISRKWIVCLSLLTFSLGTLSTGLSGGLLTLILFRSIATGAGESFYTPSALSLLSQYHQQTRGLAMSINQTALYVGIVCSSWIAAYIGESYGWRFSFMAFGGMGLFLSVLLMTRLHDVAPQTNTEEKSAKPSLREISQLVATKPTIWLLTLAFACMVFAGQGFMTWMPTLLYEQFHLPMSTAAFQSVFLHYLFAFFGVMAGGWLSDRWAGSCPVARLYIGSAGLMGSAPFLFLVGATQQEMVIYAALALFGFARGVYDSNIYAALYEVVPVRCRSSVTGLMISIAYAVGAAAPLLLGFIKQQSDLSVGMMLMGPVYALGAILIWIAARYFFRQDHLAHN
jgi:MFS family permease